MSGSRTRDIEFLWSIPLDHNCSWLPPFNAIPKEHRNNYRSIRPIRCVNDDTADKNVRSTYDWGIRTKNAFNQYKRIAASFRPWYRPHLNGRLDEFRWKLHLKLLKWGVII